MCLRVIRTLRRIQTIRLGLETLLVEVGGRQEIHELDLVVVDNLDVLLVYHSL